jgi:uncharacterized protein YhaN
MNLAARLRGRKAASASVPTDWRVWPEWQRAQEQATRIKTEAAAANTDFVEAKERLAGIQAERDEADLAAILGDAPGDAAEILSASLPGAERAVTDAGRRLERFEAASREMDVRLAQLGAELEARFRAEWRSAYLAALAHAGLAANDAASAQEQLATLWTLGGPEHAAEHAGAAALPGPTPTLRLGHARSVISPWLAAVRACGVDVDA